MRAPACLAAFLAAAVLAGAAAAQVVLPGDPAAGRAFVRENCADCHDVERKSEETAAFYGPAFVDLAAAPTTTATSLRVFLRSPHFEMPDFILTEPQVDDIISYILTLRPAGH